MKKLSMEKLRRRAQLEREAFSELQEREKLTAETKRLRREQKYRDLLQGGRRVKGGLKSSLKALKGVQRYADRKLGVGQYQVRPAKRTRVVYVGSRKRRGGRFVSEDYRRPKRRNVMRTPERRESNPYAIDFDFGV